MVATPWCKIFVLLRQLGGLHFHVRIHGRDHNLFIAARLASANAIPIQILCWALRLKPTVLKWGRTHKAQKCILSSKLKSGNQQPHLALLRDWHGRCRTRQWKRRRCWPKRTPSWRKTSSSASRQTIRAGKSSIVSYYRLICVLLISLSVTPKKETHRLHSGEYQLCDFRPMLIFFCSGSPGFVTEGELANEPFSLTGAVERSSPGTGLVGERLWLWKIQFIFFNTRTLNSCKLISVNPKGKRSIESEEMEISSMNKMLRISNRIFG